MATQIKSINHNHVPAESAAATTETSEVEAAAGVKPLNKITEEELVNALKKEPVFERYLNKNPHNDVKKEWIADLTKVINERAATMPKDSRGVDLVMRFPATYYPSINHVALGAMWRDENDNVRLEFLHQESITVFNGDKIAGFRGQVFNNFDTGSHFKDGKAPVETSISKYGPPDIMVSHCPHPEKILDLQMLMKGVDHPYGAFGKADEAGFTPLTCFSVTQSAREALHTGEAQIDTRSSIPHMLKAMAIRKLIATDYDSIRTLSIKDKKTGTEQIVDIETPGLTAKTLTDIFVKIGTIWGSDESIKWDVRTPRPAPEQKASL